MSPRCRNKSSVRKDKKAVRHISGANSEGMEMSEVWKTKYGPRRVRRDPPTVTEAVAAAPGLTDYLQEQIPISPSPKDLPPQQVTPQVLKTPTAPHDTNTISFSRPPRPP